MPTGHAPDLGADSHHSRARARRWYVKDLPAIVTHCRRGSKSKPDVVHFTGTPRAGGDALIVRRAHPRPRARADLRVRPSACHPGSRAAYHGARARRTGVSSDCSLSSPASGLPPPACSGRRSAGWAQRCTSCNLPIDTCATVGCWLLVGSCWLMESRRTTNSEISRLAVHPVYGFASAPACLIVHQPATNSHKPTQASAAPGARSAPRGPCAPCRSGPAPCPAAGPRRSTPGAPAPSAAARSNN